ncbi:MAG: 50S ribosomal protein L5 [candidate division TM6 bacterium GW2011_GWF2_43_17]|nr:MAG: 50S ribosomal protein L5 [candidate division TM6 bacterium GW2011_GWF2_43_17]HAU30132.1 50S ribosomal protein L5 [Candidatus Dependentiae bacterium]
MANGNLVSSGQNRLKALYRESVQGHLKETLELKNIMEVPRLSKVVLNVGVKGAVSDSKEMGTVLRVLEAIAAQSPVKRAARTSIAGFKIREGMEIGACVTLRGERMYAFLDKLINLALPKVRDFQGVSARLDGRGNYNLGVKDWIIFPEAEAAGAGDKTYGLNVTICTTTQNDEHARALLSELGMPFSKKRK